MLQLFRFFQNERTIKNALLFSITLSLIFALHLAWTQEINWDEFLYLAQVYEYDRGELSRTLQTFHVHFWGWLTDLDTDEVRQIQIARAFGWGFQCITVGMIYVIARVFVTTIPALFAALAYLSFDYVLIHGTSFRTDTLSSCLIMICAAAILRLPLNKFSVALITIFGAVSVMITIKVALLLPAVLAAILWRLQKEHWSRKALLFIVQLILGGVVLLGLLYFWHQSTMATAGVSRSAKMVASATQKLVVETDLFPLLGYLIRAVFYAPISSLMMVLGAGVLLFGQAKNARRPSELAIIILMISPICAFAFYRNSFPYFYPFILPPSMLLVGLFLEQIKTHYVMSCGLTLLLTMTSSTAWYARSPHDLAYQRQTLETIHHMFPEPVNYIDRSRSVPSFRHVGYFMSTWGHANYRSNGQPIYESQLRNRLVPLVLANTAILHAALIGEDTSDSARLLPEDAEIIGNNYIHHWGDIWVAGKEIKLEIEPLRFDIQIPGIYTIESAADVEIDGKRFRASEQIDLGRGSYQISSDKPQTVRLRWGDRLFRPEAAAPDVPFFHGFLIR